MSACLSFPWMFVCFSLCLSLSHPPLCLFKSLCLSRCLSVCLSIYLSIYLYHFLSVSVSQSIYFFVNFIVNPNLSELSCHLSSSSRTFVVFRHTSAHMSLRMLASMHKNIYFVFYVSHFTANYLSLRLRSLLHDESRCCLGLPLHTGTVPLNLFFFLSMSHSIFSNHILKH